MQLIALAKQRPHHLGAAEQQRQPVKIRGFNLTPFSGHQVATMVDEAASPIRVNQIAMAVHPEELEGGVAGPGPTRLPMADGAQADAEEARSLFASESTEDPSVAELCVADYGTMRRFV
ncbi:hypothetical protein MUG10_21430 [Xanthomonas prunicola]|uniref:Uncharacterized protein n=1 Tax=Xanthomonas prunicola TaxID=2053930 RepID=A0A9Q9IXM0_9XANT|nr:hypothetical protein [Xanthomonas prunicola]USJ00446.1 hypothetical protein MUG10_21430 [Xanthomonas prunicola]UXA48998.1 hypothetical protein M0D44_22685 [Xanthomonas prunicola]UXA57302.1 hypothetical protein M0D47_21745 [Xanthomonas prunicola]UXA63253.1 hypothetical protein M0D48_10165 [Xanthomonas prunicola]UXA65465.1 hypothetical protein M0D43_21830 [Xanthomonas prunicola]